MVKVKFLLFRGNWENEGNLCALETKNDILLLAAGENAPFLNNQEVTDYSYLTKNRAKIQAILLPNSLPKNSAFLPQLYQELNLHCPLYASEKTSLILSYLWPEAEKIRSNLRIMESQKIFQAGEFSLQSLPLNSYVLGNLAFLISYQDYEFYYLQDFVFNNLLNNTYLADADFFTQLNNLTKETKKNSYLITACPSLAWNRQNSLLLLAQSWKKDQEYFFLLYDYDWLHILELEQLARQWGKKIYLANPEFLALLKKIGRSKEILAKEKENTQPIYLLLASPARLESQLATFLAKKPWAKDTNITLVIGTSAQQAGESKIAKIVDSLYQEKGEVLNFGRSETFSLGTTFADLKLLLELIKPHSVLLLQNSYKQKNFLVYLEKVNFLPSVNQSFLTFPEKKVHPFPPEKWETEKILLTQRQSLLQNGFLVVFLTLKWEKELLKIKNLQLESVAVAPTVNWKKLEEKIRYWWENKISQNSNEKNQGKKNLFSETSLLAKNWKRPLEKRLEFFVRSYLSSEYDIELKNPIISLFLAKNERENPT